MMSWWYIVQAWSFSRAWWAFWCRWKTFVYGTSISKRNVAKGNYKGDQDVGISKKNGWLLSKHRPCLSYITNNSDFSCFNKKKFFKVEAHKELSTFDYVSGAFEWTVDDINREWVSRKIWLFEVDKWFYREKSKESYLLW